MEIYNIKGLSFSYPSSEKDILSDISVTVSSGEFVTLCGASGSGKSTFLRQLKSCLQPYGSRSGDIIFKGKNIDSVDEREQAAEMGFVMQSAENQSVTDKVWHELSFGLESLGLNSETIQKRTAEIAAFFGIEKWYDKNISELSGGQKQILNLASVMVMQPEVLILDEPTAQLDPIASEEFISMLKKINTSLGTTVIISEHNLEEVFSISDRIIVMSEGRIIFDGLPKEAAENLFSAKDKMFSALPVPSRVYCLSNCKGDVPLNVSEGRNWLSDFTENITLRKIEKEIETESSGKPVLELKDVRFRYEKSSPDILSDVNMKVYSGEIFTILGGNGAGKTTLITTAAGINTPYSGKIKINGKEINYREPVKNRIVYLPQNPQTLFLKSTVEEELYDILSDKGISKEVKDNMVRNIIKICNLEGLQKRHPYDLSGGEQQRTALAKLLLTKPEILLLDEPVKGLDSDSKKKIAKILQTVVKHGTAVVMVSHDMEFCAEYSDRCALFFGGSLVGTSKAKNFFSDNAFYTTSARRMSAGMIDNAVTCGDILYAVGKDVSNDIDNDINKRINSLYAPNNADIDINRDELPQKKKSFHEKIISTVILVLFFISALTAVDVIKIPYISEKKYVSYMLMLLFATVLMIPSIVLGRKEKNSSISIKPLKRSSKLIIAAAVVLFIFIPVTIAVGIYFLNDTKYLFISLLIMLECMIPFFVRFEKRSIQTRELVLIAVMCGLCIIGRTVFYMLPEFKPITALVIISGAVMGGETGFLIGSVSMLVSNIIFGQGPWTPWQMLAMGIIGFLSGILYECKFLPKNRISFAVYGFFTALVIYGGIMNPATVIMSRLEFNSETLAAYFSAGFPLDVVHALSTAFFLYFGAEPMIKILERVKIKYGLVM